MSDAQFRCNRCGSTCEYNDEQPVTLVLDDEGYDLCESCARAAKQWVSETPRVPLSTGPTLSDSLEPLTGKEPTRSEPDRPSSLPPLEGFQGRDYD